MQLWLWTLNHLQKATDADGAKLYQSSRQGVTFPLADALCWLLASRCQILDLLELEKKGPEVPTVAEGLAGPARLPHRPCHVQAAHAAGEVGRVCAELVFGYNRHPSWDTEGCASCYQAEELERMEALDPRHRQPRPRLHRRDRELTARTRAKPAPASASTGSTSSPACACAWMAASPVRSWPRTAPPKRSPRS